MVSRIGKKPIYKITKAETSRALNALGFTTYKKQAQIMNCSMVGWLKVFKDCEEDEFIPNNYSISLLSEIESRLGCLTYKFKFWYVNLIVAQYGLNHSQMMDLLRYATINLPQEKIDTESKVYRLYKKFEKQLSSVNILRTQWQVQDLKNLLTLTDLSVRQLILIYSDAPRKVIEDLSTGEKSEESTPQNKGDKEDLQKYGVSTEILNYIYNRDLEKPVKQTITARLILLLLMYYEVIDIDYCRLRVTHYIDSLEKEKQRANK